MPTRVPRRAAIAQSRHSTGDIGLPWLKIPLRKSGKSSNARCDLDRGRDYRFLFAWNILLRFARGMHYGEMLPSICLVMAINCFLFGSVVLIACDRDVLSVLQSIWIATAGASLIVVDGYF